MSARFVCCLLLVFAAHSSAASGADKQGKFFVGGGVGSTTCPAFLDAMASARQAGGVASPSGVVFVVGFVNYVAGFQTGYNLAAAGVYDVFAKMHMESFDALFAIEAWCKDNPTAAFGTGVAALAEKLRREAR